jgi:hypothetical protein
VASNFTTRVRNPAQHFRVCIKLGSFVCALLKLEQVGTTFQNKKNYDVIILYFAIRKFEILL